MSLMTRIASLPLFTINICAHIDVLFKINKEIPTRAHTQTQQFRGPLDETLAAPLFPCLWRSPNACEIPHRRALPERSPENAGVKSTFHKRSRVPTLSAVPETQGNLVDTLATATRTVSSSSDHVEIICASLVKSVRLLHARTHPYCCATFVGTRRHGPCLLAPEWPKTPSCLLP